MVSLSEEEVVKERVYVNPIVASSVIILAYPNSPILELTEKLKLMKDKGYEIGHRFRSSIEGHYSEELNPFLGLLEIAGYTHETGVVSLTEKGINLLEVAVLKGFIEDSELTTRFAEDADLELNPIIQKYLQKYLEITEPK